MNYKRSKDGNNDQIGLSDHYTNLRRQHNRSIQSQTYLALSVCPERLVVILRQSGVIYPYLTGDTQEYVRDHGHPRPSRVPPLHFSTE